MNIKTGSNNSKVNTEAFLAEENIIIILRSAKDKLLIAILIPQLDYRFVIFKTDDFNNHINGKFCAFMYPQGYKSRLRF